MGVCLPLDIWRKVATRYLPPHCLAEYQSVNSAFFTKTTYSFVRFDGMPAQQCKKHLNCLLYPVASHYIRALHLDLFTLGKLSITFRRVVYGVTVELREQPEKVLYNMSGIGSKLCVLRMDLTPGFCRTALSPSIVFPCLEEFFVVLSCEFLTTEATPTLLEAFAPFLNNHHATLRTLCIHWHPMGYNRLNISALLLRLHHFPQLNTFELSHDFISIHESDDAGLRHVLQLHAHQLRKLSLHISRGGYQERHCLEPAPRRWYEQQFLQVRLTNLQELDLAMQMFFHIDKTATYLHQFANTLTSLTLKNRCLSYNHVNTLAKAFAGQNILKRLSITVDILSPSLLVVLAEDLSNLESLSLRHRYLKSPSAFKFCNTVDHHLYPQWKLRNLSIISDELGPEHLQMCQQALKAAFPSLGAIRVDHVPAEDEYV